MRSTPLAICVSLGMVLAIPSQVRAQGAEHGLPVSLDRIREGLSRPPPMLDVAAPPGDAPAPTFRLEVRASPFVLRSPDERAFDPTYGLPSVGQLLMTGIEKAADYKRRRAERRARQEVADALAAFCAARQCTPPKTGK
jgi:hypothetical protein